MTSEEASRFLKEVRALYPKFLETKDTDIAYALWHEMLQDVTYKRAHMALIEYQKNDLTGYCPTFGQLFPPEEPTYIRDESIEDWN